MITCKTCYSNAKNCIEVDSCEECCHANPRKPMEQNMSEGKQGGTTLEEPFTSNKGKRETQVMFRGSEMFAHTDMSDYHVESMVRCLNEAFRRGFVDAAEKLMNQE